MHDIGLARVERSQLIGKAFRLTIHQYRSRDVTCGKLFWSADIEHDNTLVASNQVSRICDGDIGIRNRLAHLLALAGRKHKQTYNRGE